VIWPYAFAQQRYRRRLEGPWAAGSACRIRPYSLAGLSLSSGNRGRGRNSYFTPTATPSSAITVIQPPAERRYRPISNEPGPDLSLAWFQRIMATPPTDTSTPSAATDAQKSNEIQIGL
jgi:hypothetical protein